MSTNFEQGLDVEGNVNLTGNIIVGGNTIAGDANTDNVTFNADVSSDIIPNLDKTYSLGTITKRWDNIFGDALNLESGLSAASAVVTTSVTAEEFISTSTGTPTLSSGSDIIINPTGQVNVTSNMEVTGDLLVQGVLSNLLNWSIVESSGVLTFVNSVSGNTVTLPDVTDTLATQAYVNQQITAENLDFAGDTGGNLVIDLDSEVLTIAGGTGINTVGSGNTLTINIDSSVATKTYADQAEADAITTANTYTDTAIASAGGGGGAVLTDNTTVYPAGDYIAFNAGSNQYAWQIFKGGQTNDIVASGQATILPFTLTAPATLGQYSWDTGGNHKIIVFTRA